MQPKDLRVGPPRRWSERVDGIVWLPRLIDKCRAAQAGTLGTYLFGQSPIDNSFLRALRMGYPEFVAVVSAAENDAAVAAALRARDPESYERVRRWSDRMQRKERWIMHLIDIDDGYARFPIPAALPAIHAIANGLAGLLRRFGAARA